jgi:hypothetical protein
VSKTLPWFRMWSDAVDDDKLRLLSFDVRWHFVAVLCLKCQGVLDTRDPQLIHRKVSVKLGLTEIEAEMLLKRLVTVGLCSTRWQPKNWGKRQFKSDTSTYRVQQFRKRSRNTAVTPSESDTDTDTDLKKATEVAEAKTEEPDRWPTMTHAEKREEGRRRWPRVLAAIQAPDLQKSFPPNGRVQRAIRQLGGWQRLGQKNRDLRGQTEQQFLNAYAEIS